MSIWDEWRQFSIQVYLFSVELHCVRGQTMAETFSQKSFEIISIKIIMEKRLEFIWWWAVGANGATVASLSIEGANKICESENRHV